MAPNAKRTSTILAAIVIVLAAIAVVGWLIVKRMVASKVAAFADRRALVLDYQSSSLGFGSVGLRTAEIRPKHAAGERVRVTANAIDARVAGLEPYFAEVDRADVALDGSIEEVTGALDEVRGAGGSLREDERIPVDVHHGTIHWQRPFGSKSSIYFAQMLLSSRPKEGMIHVELGGGRIETGSMRFQSLDLTVDEKPGGAKRTGGTVDVEATLAADNGGKAALSGSRTNETDEGTLILKKFSLASLRVKSGGLDLTGATADGTMTLSRTRQGAARSTGKLTLRKVTAGPFALGPISAEFTTDAIATWKGSPKQGVPGTMTLDEASIVVVFRGRQRAVAVTGEVSIGPEGRGPFLVDVRLELAGLACADVAAGMGGMAGAIVSSAVTGGITVRGGIRGDLGALDKAKNTLSFAQDCAISTSLPSLPLPFP